MRPAWLQLTNEIVERYGYTVPELLTRIRVVYHLSQSQLATAVGVGHATISHWECGRHSPRANLLIELLNRYPIPTRFEFEARDQAGLPAVAPAVVLPPTVVTPALPMPVAVQQTKRGLCAVCKKVRIATVLVDAATRQERGLLCVLHTLASELLEERAEYTRRLLALHEQRAPEP